MKFTREAWPVWCVLLLGIVLTFAMAHAVRLDIDRDANRRIEFAGEQITSRVRDRLDAQAVMLRATAAFMAQHGTVDRAQWRGYVASLRDERAMAGVQGVGFAALIRPEAFDAHVAAIRAEGFPAYRVWPEGKRPFYTSIIFLEPFEGRNLRAFGYDMYTEPVRRDALIRARDSGELALSGKVRLLQETSVEPQAGTLIYAPVYRSGLPVTTVAERRAALLGWTYSPYRMTDLVSTILRDWQGETRQRIGVCIHDGPEAAPSAFLFDSGGACDSPMARQGEARRTIDFHGRRWALAFTLGDPMSVRDYGPVWGAIALGLLITGLLTALIRSLLAHRYRAEIMARQLTGDIREREAALVENERRWRSALDGSELGVWDWDLVTDKVYFSRIWKEMLGFREDELANELSEWQSRVHPDDLPRTLADVQEVLQGRATYYRNEHRLRCKDGVYRWILDRGTVFERAPDGTPLRMVGTHADIDEVRQAALRAERHANLYAALAACNAAIARRASIEELAETACQILVSHAHLVMVWIGFVDPGTGLITPFRSAGTGLGYLDGITVSIRADDPHGNGPTGTAFRENQPVWVNDFANDPRTQPWHDRAVQYGWHGSAALPLRRQGQPAATLTMYSGEAGFFDEDTQALLADMASQFSIALDALDAEQSAETFQNDLAASEQRYRSVMESSADGIMLLTGEGQILSANPVACEMFGYSEEELMRIGRDGIVAPDDPRLAALIAERGRTGKAHGELTMIRAGGIRFEVEVSTATYREQNGELRLSAITRDISVRKADQARLAAQLDELRRWYDSMLGREKRIVELKREINEAVGEQRYEITAADIGNAPAEAMAETCDKAKSAEEADELARIALLNVIEDKKRSEEQLRNSETRFRSMFEAAPLGIALMDSDSSRFLDVNSMLQTIVGWNREELLAKRWQDITHPDDLNTDLEMATRFLAGQIPGYHLKKRYIRKDGSPVWVNMSISSFAVPGETQRRHLCMIEDITERERIARAFADEEAKFRALTEQSTMGVYITDSGAITYINPAGAAMFGYSVGEVVGRQVTDFITAPYRPEVSALINRRVAGESIAFNGDLQGIRKDGSEFWFAVESSTTEINGRLQILGVVQDITNRKKAEQDILDYVARIENMISGTVDAISFMVELRDPYTSGHERRVGELSAAIAAEMGLDQTVQRGLRLAGAVHDVGKLAVPSEILTKSGRLTPLEFEIIKAHATQGYEVLKGIDSPWPLAEIARQHHERLDGSGYPRGLKDGEIIIEARIVAVADVVESMSSHRPYRAALGPEAALAEIERGRGALFDPDVVDATVRLIRDKGYVLDGKA